MDRRQDQIDMETFNSQEFMEYLNEYRFASLEAEEPTDDDTPPDDGEEEEEWLRQAGFGSFISALDPTSESGDTEWEGFTTLSHRQAAVVKRRMQALRSTAQRRRGQPRCRRPGLRGLFPSEGGSTGSRSRSATPDSLDPLSPPLTPPETAARLQAGSPSSQGYHSSSRGSLDRLQAAEEEQTNGLPEYRHVLRISLDAQPSGKWQPEEATKSLGRRRELKTKSLDPGAEKTARSRDRRPEEAEKSRDRAAARRVRSRDAPDRGRRPLSLFETSGRYDLGRPPSSPSDSSGIETVSFQSVGSVRRPRERPSLAVVRSHPPLTEARGHPPPTEARGHPPLTEARGHAPLTTARAHPPLPGGRPSLKGGLPAPAEDGGVSSPPPPTSLHSPAAPAAGLTGAALCRAEERLGRTRLGDLSESDVQRVQKLALLELTGLLDEHGLVWRRRKPRRRRLGARSSADAGVFGASLASLLKRDRHRQRSAPPVPLAFEKILAHLERHGVREEGLLRVPGHRQKTEQLRQLIDEQFYARPAAVDAALERSSANDVAALLKQLLRELPAPLLTDESLDAFYRSDALPPGPDQLQALSLLCLRLPAPNRALLRRLLSFLAAIAAHERVNKMTLENVAMVMAPNLIPPPCRRQKDITAEITYAAVTSRVVKRLVQHRDQLWLVPPQFVRQVRLQHEEEVYERARRDSAGPMKKLLRRRETAIVRKIDNEVDFQEGVIRVCAAQFGRNSWPVRLATDTTAGDLITSCLREVALSDPSARRRVDRRLQSAPSTPGGSTVCTLGAADLSKALHTHFLHEHGGNIGERRLEHGAVLLDCYQENPNARWVIHCCHGAQAGSSSYQAI